jgi:hypothetical protein
MINKLFNKEIVIVELYKHALYQGFFPTALYANIPLFYDIDSRTLF